MISEAKEQRQEFLSLQSHLKADFAELIVKQAEFRQKVKSNMRTKENPNGVLTRKESDYFECLEIKHEQFTNLLSQDEAHWGKNLELTIRDAEEL